jgi:hypothetical protein
MTSNYNGVGFAGDPLDTIGDVSNGVYPIQDYLTFPGGALDADFDTPLYADAARIILGNTGTVTGPDVVRNFLRFLYSNNSIPTSVEEMIVELRVFTYAQYKSFGISAQIIIPGITGSMPLSQRMQITRDWLAANRPDELDYNWSPNTIPNVLDTMSANFGNAIGITTENWVVTIGGVTKPFNNFANSKQKAYLQSLLEDAYAQYAKQPLPAIPPDGSNPAGTQLAIQWITGFNEFLQDVVKVNQASTSTVSKLSFEQFYNAFFDNTALAGQFEDFFNAFVLKVYGDPVISSNNPTAIPGSQDYFVPTLVFNQFTQEVLGQYFKTIGGSTPLGSSSSDAGSAKTLVLNRIFSLLVMMIEALQKVAAAQSDRLVIYSKWQNAYTDLQNQVKYASSGDSRFNSDLSNNTQPRTDFNSQNAAYTETIKANSSIISDTAKNLQTNINQSTDAINQQASTATSILQELASILSALYR